MFSGKKHLTTSWQIVRMAALLAVVISLTGTAAWAAQPAGEPIKIGLQAPLTGDYAYEGKGFEQSIKLLVDQTNETGGLLGRPVELIVEDDKGDPKEASLVADRLITAGVVAVIGGYNSTATEASSEIFNEAGLLQVTPSSTATRLTTKGYERFFRTCFLDDRQALFAATFMVETLGAKKIGLVHDNSTYAKGLADWTEKYLKDLGIEPTIFVINPDDQDFTPVLTAIKGAKLDAVYFTGYHAQGGLLLKQAGDIGLQVQWLMGNASNNPELITIAGLDRAKGTIVTTEPLPGDLPYPEAQKFIEDFTAAYGSPPASVWWVMAADAYAVIRHAIETVGSTDSEALAKYLHTEFKDFPGITGPILGFDEKGDRLGTIHKAYVIDDQGNFVVYGAEKAAEPTAEKQ